jgi:cytochrome P450
VRRNNFHPVPELAALRDGPGIARAHTHHGDAWLVTRLADVRAVMSDVERFSTARSMDPSTSNAGDPLLNDPPEHTRLRRLLAPHFTAARSRRLEPLIRQIIDERLEAMAQGNPPVDLITEFAYPIPMLVICELLGVPLADRAQFQARNGRTTDLSLSPDERALSRRESREYLSALVARARSAPGEDILGTLIAEHGEELTDKELIGIAAALIFAGTETTANMLGLGALALLRHPEQLALIQRQPELIDAAIEELLRWLSIAHAATPRIAKTDVEIAGQHIGAGERVICVLASANRDPRLTTAPDELDITRGTTAHAALGHGAHYCLGAPLARLEMKLAFPALFQRFPGLTMINEKPVFRPMSAIYGLTTLPVSW